MYGDAISMHESQHSLTWLEITYKTNLKNKIISSNFKKKIRW